MAAEVANLFAKEFIDYNLKLNIDGSMKAVEDLRIRADQQKDRVEELELKLLEYREQNNAVSLKAMKTSRCSTFTPERDRGSLTRISMIISDQVGSN